MYTFNADGRKIELSEQEIARDVKVPFMVVRYAEDVHNFGPGVMVAYRETGEPKTLWFLNNVEKMKSHTVSGSKISLEGISGQYYTGLQVSHDPGVPLVLSGFIIMLAGLYINFFTGHRRIYLLEDSGMVMVRGICSRNNERFSAHLKKIGEDPA